MLIDANAGCSLLLHHRLVSVFAAWLACSLRGGRVRWGAFWADVDQLIGCIVAMTLIRGLFPPCFGAFLHHPHPLRSDEDPSNPTDQRERGGARSFHLELPTPTLTCLGRG